jgi:hypothetical protein
MMKRNLALMFGLLGLVAVSSNVQARTQAPASAIWPYGTTQGDPNCLYKATFMAMNTCSAVGYAFFPTVTDNTGISKPITLWAQSQSSTSEASCVAAASPKDGFSVIEGNFVKPSTSGVPKQLTTTVTVPSGGTMTLECTLGQSSKIFSLSY